MKKLLKLLSGYDNYLDEGAVFELIDRLSNYNISNTIIYEINVVNDVNLLCKNYLGIECRNHFGRCDNEIVCDLYLTIVFTKNIISSKNHFKSSLQKEAFEVMKTILNESDYTVECDVDLHHLSIFEKSLINLIRRRLEILSKKELNLIGLHNMYDNIDFNPFQDAIILGYDRGNILIAEFIPEIKVELCLPDITLT